MVVAGQPMAALTSSARMGNRVRHAGRFTQQQSDQGFSKLIFAEPGASGQKQGVGQALKLGHTLVEEFFPLRDVPVKYI